MAIQLKQIPIISGTDNLFSLDLYEITTEPVTVFFPGKKKTYGKVTKNLFPGNKISQACSQTCFYHK